MVLQKAFHTIWFTFNSCHLLNKNASNNCLIIIRFYILTCNYGIHSVYMFIWLSVSLFLGFNILCSHIEYKLPNRKGKGFCLRCGQLINVIPHSLSPCFFIPKKKCLTILWSHNLLTKIATLQLSNFHGFNHYLFEKEKKHISIFCDYFKWMHSILMKNHISIFKKKDKKIYCNLDILWCWNIRKVLQKCHHSSYKSQIHNYPCLTSPSQWWTKLSRSYHILNAQKSFNSALAQID